MTRQRRMEVLFVILFGFICSSFFFMYDFKQALYHVLSFLGGLAIVYLGLRWVHKGDQ